jgi:hypothetical protein
MGAYLAELAARRARAHVLHEPDPMIFDGTPMARGERTHTPMRAHE